MQLYLTQCTILMPPQLLLGHFANDTDWGGGKEKEINRK